jgi:hypothetical protein
VDEEGREDGGCGVSTNQPEAKSTDVRLDPEFKAKWVAALRSGEYQQCTGKLRSDQGFCCLGVALDLIDHAEWESQHWRDIYLKDIGPTAPVIGIQRDTAYSLAEMNDGESCEKRSFSEIADYIEKYL